MTVGSDLPVNAWMSQRLRARSEISFKASSTFSVKSVLNFSR